MKKIEYLRTITAPPTSPSSLCGPGYIASPLPYGGDLYALTSGEVSKYNPATGSLIWQTKLNSSTEYQSMAVSGNLVIVAGIGCGSISEPGGFVYALNTSTGAIAWSYNDDDTIDNMVKAGSYVLAVGDDAAGYEVSVLNVSDGKVAWFGGSGCDFGPSTAGQALNAATGQLIRFLASPTSIARAGARPGPGHQARTEPNPGQ